MSQIEAFRRKALLVGIESTYGTDPTPAPASDAVVVLDGSSNVEADRLAREIDRATFGEDPHVLVNKRATISGGLELIGAEAAGDAAPIGPVLRACGFAETLDEGPPAIATYNPISNDFESVTGYFYHAGIRYRSNGMLGALESLEFAIRQFPRAQFTLTGLMVAPDEQALPSDIDLSAFQSPVAAETETLTVSIDGTELNAVSVSLNTNMEVVVHEGSELRRVWISDRRPSGTLTIYRPELSSWNPWTIADSLSKVPLVVTCDGGSAGQKVTLTAPLIQLEYAQATEIDGAAGLEIPFVCTASDAGDDDLELEFA